MSKKIPQRNVNLANKLMRLASDALMCAAALTESSLHTDTHPMNVKAMEDKLIDALSSCREFRRKPIQRNNIT